jgi:hypothetical protein
LRAIRRATRSEPAPAENGTIMRIDFSGNGCAGTLAAASDSEAKSSERESRRYTLILKGLFLAEQRFSYYTYACGRKYCA